MLSPDKIDRINVLARKRKDGSITPEEEREQKALREEYMSVFRKTFREQLDSIKVVDEEEYQEYQKKNDDKPMH